ncbi:TonB-dependent receptor, partial [bacterium]|nr:TonB-dependent receptor [bacterium]
EYRYTDTEIGDLGIRFWPDVNPNLRQKARTKSIRLGFHHSFTPRSDLIASFIYQDADRDLYSSFLEISPIDDDGFLTEIQHMFRTKRFSVTTGIGHFNADERAEGSLSFQLFPDLSGGTPDISNTHTHHTNLYVYSLINYPENVTWTLGASADFFEGGNSNLDRDQFNPKFGISWSPFPATKLHAAAFRTFNRTLISNQTLEPTHVAGFNQFFHDFEATKAWRYSIGIDQKFSSTVYGGVEFSKRDLDVPFFDPDTSKNPYSDWEERLVRTYIYWAPCPWMSTSAEYQYERFARERKYVGPENFYYIKTQRLPLGIKLFHPWGFIAGLKTTYIDQKANFKIYPSEEDQFWVVDASIGYRLPKRWGLITIEAKNLFNESFNYQDTDTASIRSASSTLPLNPLISPERLILTRITLAF